MAFDPKYACGSPPFAMRHYAGGLTSPSPAPSPAASRASPASPVSLALTLLEDGASPGSAATLPSSRSLSVYTMDGRVSTDGDVTGPRFTGPPSGGGSGASAVALVGSAAAAPATAGAGFVGGGSGASASVAGSVRRVVDALAVSSAAAAAGAGMPVLPEHLRDAPGLLKSWFVSAPESEVAQVLGDKLASFERFQQTRVSKKAKECTVVSAAKLREWQSSYSEEREAAEKGQIDSALALMTNSASLESFEETDPSTGASAAFLPTSVIVLGGEEIRGASHHLASNFGFISSFSAFRMRSRGSILNDAHWNIFKNDAYMLGVVRSQKDVYLSTSKIPSSLLWDDRAKRPRVLGRELLWLMMSGYVPVDTSRVSKGKDLGADHSALAFTCVDPSMSRSITMGSFLSAMSKIKSLDGLLNAYGRLQELHAAKLSADPRDATCSFSCKFRDFVS